MALPSIIEPFVWGRGGAKMTPEQIAREREIAAALGKVDTSPVGHWLEGAARMASALSGRIKEGRADKAETANATASEQRIADMLAATGPQQFPAAPTANGGGSPDYADQRVSQAFGDTNASGSAQPGEVESYIRQAAAARGIDPDIAVRVAKSEGGLKNPFRHGEGPAPRSQAPGLSDKEHSFGPFQLYISGTGAGLGDRAVAAGIDPRKNWKGGIDFALDEVARKGWGQWYGAKASGITGMMGVGQRPAAAGAVDAFASGQPVPPAPAAQVASLDPSIGLPETAPIPTPGPENVPVADGKGDRVAMAQAAPVPMQPGPLSSDPRHVAFMGRMTDPQPMGGSPMPMQGAAAAPSGQEKVAQALAGPDLSQIPVTAGGNAGVYQPGQPMGVNPAMVQALASPYASDQEKQIAGLLLKQQLEQQAQAADPMRALQLEKARLENEQLRSGVPGINSSFGNLAAQAKAAGLVPGSPEYQEFMLNGGGAPATFRALDMQARAAGFQPGTPEYNDFMATRGAGLQANAAQTGKNVADANTGFDAELARSSGTAVGAASVKAGTDAWADYGKLQTSIGNIDEAISAIDNGAQSGVIYKMLPNITEASASLQNAMDRMGLDVIGSVTFGSLSADELRLAMQTAAPRDLAPPELRAWLARKRDAQIKAADMLADAAQYLTKPGNTINGWIERNRAAKAQSEQTPATGTDQPTGKRLRFNPATGELE